MFQERKKKGDYLKLSVVVGSSNNSSNNSSNSSMKRKNIDGQLSREEYDDMDEGSSYQPGTFTKATPNTLASRRRITATRVDKRTEFSIHIQALNTSFSKWFKEQVAKDPSIDLTNGVQDYIDYSTQLQDRYLKSYGEVLTFGSGDCGQLAHGTEEDEDLMVRFPRVVYSLRDKKVCGIACGGLHNAVVTEQGQVFTWGCADDGSLGRVGDENHPLLVDGLRDEVIISVACGDGQTIAVSAKGEVWGWGAYKDKEGKKWFNPSATAPNPIKDIKKQQDVPLLIQGLSKVVEIACGSAFNLARSRDGALYSWGLGESGELGRTVPPLKKGVGEDAYYDVESILKHHLTPGHMYKKNTSVSALEIMQDVKTIGCGAYHSLVVGIYGTVWVCGLNNYSQLGIGGIESRDSLVPLILDEVVISVKGGVHHSLILTSKGKIYTFGRGDSGQLGIPGMDSAAGACSDKPVEPIIPEDVVVVEIACGGNHNLAITKNNEVYSWGYGDMLALGHGEEKDEPLPKKLNFTKAKVNNIKVTQVAGGGQHSALIGQISLIK